MRFLPKTWWIRDLIYLIAACVGITAVWHLLAMLPFSGMPYYMRIIVLIGINITLAVSLNIINGHAGQFSLGHAGFMAVGAYFASFLSFYYFQPIVARYSESGNTTMATVLQNVFLIVVVLAGGAIAAVAGYLVGLPSLRLRGDYLAIVTLGFGEIIRVFILNIEKIGGARGFSGIPAWSNFFWIYLFALITMFISNRLVNSTVGRAFLAVREDEIAAEAMGVNTTKYKVKAFVIGSFFAGVGGGLYAHFMMNLNPRTFEFTKSFELIVMVVLGGLGSISGSVVGAIVITTLYEVLRPVKQLLGVQSDPRMIVFAILLILLPRLRPQGLLGRRELWEVLARRKDTVAKDKRDQGGDDKLDRNVAPPIK